MRRGHVEVIGCICTIGSRTIVRGTERYLSISSADGYPPLCVRVPSHAALHLVRIISATPSEYGTPTSTDVEKGKASDVIRLVIV
jgi:hypothetical protein